jgi:hypothetical protein
MFSSPWFLSGYLPDALALDTSSTCVISELECIQQLDKLPQEQLLIAHARGLVSIKACTSSQHGDVAHTSSFSRKVADV